MKRRFTILTAAFALLAFLAIPMGMMGQTTKTYKLTIDASVFNTTSYVANNTQKTSNAVNISDATDTYEVSWTSNQVMKNGSDMQWQKNNGCIYNSTDLGTITNVTVTSSAGTFTTYYGTTAQPSSGTTVGGGFFQTKVGNATGKTSMLEVTFEITEGASQPVATTLTIDDSDITNTDVYAGTAAGSLSATVTDNDNNTVSGATITWSSSNEDVATIDANGEVTLVAEGTTTITASFAGESGVYYGSSDTYDLVVSDSTPFSGGDVTFVAGTDMGTSTNSNDGDEMTKKTVTISSTKAAFAYSDYRIYAGSTTTISTTEGVITQIVITGNDNSRPISGLSTNDNNFSVENNVGTWTGNATSVAFSASAQARASQIVVTVDMNSTPDPIIAANNVSFDYTTTSGEIEYSISNPVANATLIANTNDSWLTLGTVGSTSIPFTCSTNAETTARTATVTLSYVNGEATLVTKEVTVTQGAAPVSYTTIPDLFAAATTTETPAYVTFNNWVVSGISTNGKNVFVTDNNGNGFVIYGSNMSDTYTVGDILSGTAVSCTLKKYNGFAELINLDANDLTITSGGTVSTANVAMADLAGVNTGALLHYEGLTCEIDGNKTNLTDGTTTIQVYNALYAFDALEDGKTYNITGVYQQYNNTKEILPRSAADIEVAPSIVVAPASVNVNAIGNGNSGSQLYTFSITCENLQVATEYEFGIQFYDATGQNEQESPSWIVSGVGTNDAGYVVNLNIIDNYDDARYAYFKVHAPNNNVEVYSNLVTINQAAAPQQYTLVIHNPEHVTITAAFGTDVVTNAEEADLLSGTEITLTFDVENGYVLEGYTVLDANDDPVALTPVTGTENSWTFNMPNSNVFVNASAVENVAPAGGNYVRITALDQLTDGSKVIIAARFDEEHTNGYYAMPGETSGKPTGVAFTSEVSGSDKIVPATITSSEDTYYWTVNVTTDGYTFTNANNQMIGYTSGTNFATGGDNTEWTISRETAGQTALVPEYEGFVIRNGNSNGRAFAFNGQAFGAYSTSNMTGAGYNFYLDFFVQPATESISFTVTGYTELQNTDGGYCLIACPFDGVDPDGTGMITADSNYDLYKYDEPTNVWRNYKTHDNNAEPGFNLALGEGYLYANAVTTTITFSGTPVSGTTYDVTLSKTGNATNEGWNLVGNPFKVDAYIGRDFYTMNSDGTDIMTEASTGAIAPLQGVFVEANSPGETLTFTTQAQPGQKGGLTLNLSQGRGTIDRAVVRFGENRNLRKFQLFENSTKLCIAQDGEEYAVISSEAQGEMPVNFKASKNGTYTISINCEDTEFGYLHLIDNMTGADIDLIANPSYSFEANVTDYTSRFKLVFMVDEDNNNNNDNLAFVSNGQIILNGQGTVEVYDLNGRMISRNNDVTSIATDGMANGVYMIRLTNGSDVKTQKIVVK